MTTTITEHDNLIFNTLAPMAPVAGSVNPTPVTLAHPVAPLWRVTADGSGIEIGAGAGKRVLVPPNAPSLFGVDLSATYSLAAGPSGGDPLAGYDWLASSQVLPAGYTLSRSGAAPVLQGASWATSVFTSIAANLPRFGRLIDETIGLLIEPGRTQQALRSASMNDGTAWTKTGMVVTDNQAAPPIPSGTPAELLAPTASTAAKRISQIMSVTSGLWYSCGFYARMNQLTTRFCQICLGGSGGNAFGLNAYANFDLQNGLIGTVGSACEARIIPLPNGWWRGVVSAQAIATQSAEAFAFMAAQANSHARFGTVTGFNGTDGYFAWQASWEQARWQSTYQDTAGATATRAPEICLRAVTVPAAATGFSYRIRGMAAYGKPAAGEAQILHELSDNTTSNHYQLFRDSAGDGIFNVRQAGNVMMATNLGPIADGARFTVVVSAKTGDTAVARDGVVKARTATLANPAISHEQLGGGVAGGYEWGGHIFMAPASATVWPGPLNDAEMVIASAVTG